MHDVHVSSVKQKSNMRSTLELNDEQMSEAKRPQVTAKKERKIHFIIDRHSRNR